MYRTYPTTPLASIIRDSVLNAVSQGIDVRDYRTPLYIETITKSFNALSAEFNHIVELYEDSDYAEAIDKIGHVLSNDLKKVSPKF